jgi:prolyl 4-hydroxylase
MFDINVPAPSPEHNPDKESLRRVGRKVRTRLGAMKEVYKVPTEKAELFALGNFFNAEECGRLMAMIDAVAQPSKAYDVEYSTGYRTSYSGDLDPYDPFIRTMQRRIDDLLGIDPTWGETIQGQRYMEGQQFQHHTDWFPGGTQYLEMEKDRGGQRSFTAMAYLNDVEEGGTTDFPRIPCRVSPKAGMLLVWNNADPEGVPNPFTIHAGSPVVRGTKYVIPKWYRTRPWV